MSGILQALQATGDTTAISDVRDIFAQDKPVLPEVAMEEESPEKPQEEKQEEKEKEEQKNYELTEERKQNTLFVGGLSLDTSRREVKSLFKKYGKVLKVWARSLPTASESKMPEKAKVILKKFVEHQDHKNCYVLFEKKEEAVQALKENGSTLKDRVIRVDTAFGDSKNYDYTIFIGNLPFDVEDSQLREHFKAFTGIQYVRIIRDKETHKGKGIAYICFANKTDYKAAVLMNGSMFRDRRLRVKKAVEKKRLEKKQLQRDKVAEQKKQEKINKTKKKEVKKDKNVFNQKDSTKKPFVKKKIVKKTITAKPEQPKTSAVDKKSKKPRHTNTERQMKRAQKNQQ